MASGACAKERSVQRAPRTHPRAPLGRDLGAPPAHVLAGGEGQPGRRRPRQRRRQPGGAWRRRGGGAARLRHGGARTPRLGLPGHPAGRSSHSPPRGSGAPAARRDRCSPQRPAARLGGLSGLDCPELTRCSGTCGARHAGWPGGASLAPWTPAPPAVGAPGTQPCSLTPAARARS